jgi:hypothetical protein
MAPRPSGLRRALHAVVRGADIPSGNSRSVKLTSLSVPGCLPWREVLCRVAHITMAIQAIIYGALGIGILLHQRWGLILGLLYFAQVVIGHVIFFVTNFNVPSQAVHVKITAIEGPIVFLILLYLWIRSRPLLLVHASR